MFIKNQGRKSEKSKKEYQEKSYNWCSRFGYFGNIYNLLGVCDNSAKKNVGWNIPSTSLADSEQIPGVCGLYRFYSTDYMAYRGYRKYDISFQYSFIPHPNSWSYGKIFPGFPENSHRLPKI